MRAILFVLIVGVLLFITYIVDGDRRNGGGGA